MREEVRSHSAEPDVTPPIFSHLHKPFGFFKTFYEQIKDHISAIEFSSNTFKNEKQWLKPAPTDKSIPQSVIQRP